MARGGAALTDSLREAARSLLRARLRTILGLVGIAMGIASVIAMISTGEIATAEARKKFEAVGTDILSVLKSEDQPAAAQDAAIGLEDALDVADRLSTIAEAAPRIRSSGSFLYAGKDAGSGSVQGVSESFARVNRLQVAEGRFVSDLDRGRYFAVVGAEVAQKMRRLGASEVVGEIVGAGDWLYTVIGVLADTPESYALPFSVDANKSVFVPVTTVRRLSPDAQIELIVARVAPGVHYADAAADIQTFFAERSRGLAVQVTSAEQLIERMEAQLGVMTLLLGAVGSISLIVGGLGVMNVMLISVAERRREIGVRLALGASPGDIQSQFLVEALILTMGGGVVGILIGTGATYGLCRFFFEWDFFVSPTSIAAGVGVSSAIGLFFGFQPAYQASRLDPIIALQGE